MKSRLLFLAVTFLFAQSAGHSQEQPADSGLSVHEWGTFTSIAGPRGEAVSWLPQAEKYDLPGFVEHLANNRVKGGIPGTVRMETPIVYFYATHPITVSVNVSFAQGALTEWYPHATAGATLPPVSHPIPDSGSGELTWDSIFVDPAAASNFLREAEESRYYAARETTASPLAVRSKNGQQQEKFLFYRGVSSFSVPISATSRDDGSILVSNLTQTAIPQAILFERRGDRLGYRVLGPIGSLSVTEPLQLSSDLNALSRDTEKILVGQGLYADEAHAMLGTWNDSWFEEGTRLLYIVPRTFVDSVLPLAIEPQPASTTRVFVGRMEVVTPATQKAVETAFASRDHATLAKYGRFLVPILQTMLAQSTDPGRRERLNQYLNSAYADSFRTLNARR